MNTLKTNLDNFVAIHGDDNFKTRELASEFSKLKIEWWGSNLISLGIEENKDGTFSPKFNVWD